MAKPLRIGSMIETDKPLGETSWPSCSAARRRARPRLRVADLRSRRADLLAVAGSRVPGIGLGTGVVPVYPRHPMMLAQQALTVQMATDNRLLLGIGLSHQIVVESMWGISFERPAAYMREYLTSLMPLLRGETVHSTGERVTTNAFAPLDITGGSRRPVLVAALGPTPCSSWRAGGRRHRHLDDRHGDHRRHHRRVVVAFIPEPQTHLRVVLLLDVRLVVLCDTVASG